jgi:hypothetical protein
VSQQLLNFIEAAVGVDQQERKIMRNSQNTGILDSIVGVLTSILTFPLQLPGRVDERSKCTSLHDL